MINPEKENKQTGQQPVPTGRQRFPESNSPGRQLRLLAAGCMPAIRQKLYGRACRLRNAWAEFAARLRSFHAPKRAYTALFLAASMVLSSYSV